MTDIVTDPGVAVPPKSLIARLFGIITSPGDTYRAVVAYPKWFGMLALTIVIGIAATTGLLMTDRGRQAMLDAQVSQMESFGMKVDDQMYARLEQQSKYAPYTAGAGVLVSLTLFSLLVAGILFAVFNAMMGGEASFKQVYAVVVHAGAIGILHQLFSVPVSLARGTIGSVTSLGALVPMLAESSVLARFLGMIDLFYIWQIVVLSIGLAVLYRRRTQPIATALLAVYGVFALIAAVILSRLGGA